MRFRLLGTMEVRLDQRPVAIRSGKHRALLAGLLVRPNRSVPLSELVDVIWGDAPPANPHNTVQLYVTRLRAALGGAIQTTPDGYLIAADESETDLGRFESLVDRADEGDLSVEADTLREALALWRGEPLADVPSDVLQREVAPRLREQRLRALERRIDADLRLGRCADVVSELVTLTAQHPLRERFWAQLMSALSGGGRRADALEVYQTVRRQLAAELGIDPGDELQQLHATILAGRREPGDGRSVSGPPIPRQLPPDARRFTGRASELAQLDALLAGEDSTAPPDAVVISAIAGTAGVGKTALAAHWGRRVADQFPDGQLWVNLRGYDPSRRMSPEQALTVLLRGLGVSGAQIPPDLEGRFGLYRSLLDGRRLLVVLDNAGSAEQVRSLLPGTPGCLVVVTSRDDLDGLVARDGAVRVHLDLLTQDESVVLLRRLLGPAVVVDADLAAVADLARLCARLPLALRIAADRVVLDGAPLPEVVAQLANERRLDVFAAGGDPYTAVRVVFSWSYRALPSPMARLFRVLGLVPGADWDAYAAAALADCSLADARRLLGVLVAAHLVDDRGAGRFAMHDLLRAYATERAEAADTEPARHATLTRLFDHYLGTAASAMDTAFPHEKHRRPRVGPPGTPVPPMASSGQALAWLDAERPNLVSAVGHAVDHGWPTHATHLATTLYRYLIAGAHLADASTVFGRGLEAARATGDRNGEATALHSLGSVCDEWGRHEEALAYYGPALTINRELDNRTGEAYTLGNLGVVYRKMGRYEEAVEHYRQVLTISRERGDRASETAALGNLGTIHLRCGRYAEARDHYRQTLSLAQEINDRASEAASLSGLGSVYARWARQHEALDHYQRALTIIREIGIRAAEADVLCELGSIHLRLARYDDALDCCRQAVTISRETGNRVSEADAVYRFGAICLRRAEYDEADEHYRQALAIANEVGYRGIEPHSHNGQGEVCRATARPAEALAHHQTALNVASELGERYEQARAWDGLAHAHHDLGDHATAQQHWQRALTTYADLGVPEAEETRAKLDGT